MLVVPDVHTNPDPLLSVHPNSVDRFTSIAASFQRLAHVIPDALVPRPTRTRIENMVQSSPVVRRPRISSLQDFLLAQSQSSSPCLLTSLVHLSIENHYPDSSAETAGTRPCQKCTRQRSSLHRSSRPPCSTHLASSRSCPSASCTPVPTAPHSGHWTPQPRG